MQLLYAIYVCKVMFIQFCFYGMYDMRLCVLVFDEKLVEIFLIPEIIQKTLCFINNLQILHTPWTSIWTHMLHAYASY